MRRSFCLSVFLSLFASAGLHAAEESEYQPLIEEDEQESEKDFTFYNLKSKSNYYYSRYVDLSHLCKTLKAGPFIKVDQGYIGKHNKWLTFYENEKWVNQKVTEGSTYILNLYCSKPSREFAKKVIMDELRISQTGSKTNTQLWHKMVRAYPDIMDADLAWKFFKAEQRKRGQSCGETNMRNYNEGFAQTLINKYPQLGVYIRSF